MKSKKIVTRIGDYWTYIEPDPPYELPKNWDKLVAKYRNVVPVYEKY